MNTPEDSIKNSFLNSHQGAILGAMGGFDHKMKDYFTGAAQNLSTVVSRLGVGAAALAIITMAGLTAPGQAQAQNWATQNGVNDAFQQQRQVDFANQAARVAAEQRGLSRQDQNLVGLAALGASAITKNDKAPLAAALVGVGAAMLIPNNNQNSQGLFGNSNNGGSSFQAPRGFSGGSSGYQQSNNQSQAMQQAYASYLRFSTPQYQVALQANMEGNVQARRDAVMSFGNAWNAASQVGVPLHTVSEEVTKFQQMQRLDNEALNAGLAGVRAQQPTVTYGQGFNR